MSNCLIISGILLLAIGAACLIAFVFAGRSDDAPGNAVAGRIDPPHNRADRARDPVETKLPLTVEQRDLIQQCYIAEYSGGRDYPDIKLLAFYEMVCVAQPTEAIPVYRAQLPIVRAFAATHRLTWLLELLSGERQGVSPPSTQSDSRNWST